jgi:hypothetical protein
MGLVEKSALVAALSPPFDPLLANQLVDEFVSLERRFIQRDWGPSQLDGGRFCEVLARILYHQDSGNLNLGKDYDDCLKYIVNDQVKHAIQPQHDARHMAIAIKTVYKFRSQRGGVHISPTYTPNHMDSKFVMEVVRWLMNETLRIFWQGDREKVAKAIRELLQFDVPCVGKFEDVVMVQRTDLSPIEETLVILHFAGEVGLTRKDIGRYVMATPQRVSDALRHLTDAKVRQAVLLASGVYRLTDLGVKEIRERLVDKLLLT